MIARRLAVAALAALVLSAPAIRAQIPAEVREAAADRVWVRDYLRLYDQVLTMQAATGRITGAQADAQLAAAGRELYTKGYREQDMTALRDALRAAAGPFLDGVEAEIAASTSWSGELTPESHRELTSGMLRYVRSELDRALARGADPVTALRAATLLLAMARGYESLPDDLDFFAGSRDRAAATVPGIELMPIDGSVRLLPPPAEARPPVISSPGPRVNAAGGGGGATRVVLRGGTVEAEARLVGRGSTDVVGRTARPRADGQPDTEIELRILGPGLVIVGMEVRHEPTDAGRLANRVLGTWSTLRNSGRPLLGVMANRGLLNRADGQMGGISLGDRATLSLYIQDDGQIERSADPGTVVVFFQGGERATFPITRGGARGGALAGGGARPPAGGAGGGVRPPTGGNPPIVTTIPRSFPPAGGGMPPMVPVVPTGGGGAPAGGGGAPATAFNGTLRPDRTTYTQGQPMMVSFAAFPGTNDWIAIAPAGAAAESYGEWRWTERRQSGALPFTAPAPGQYELRAYLDWPNGGHTVRVRTPFTVTAGAAPPVVSGGGGVPPTVGGVMPPAAGGGGAPAGGTVPSRLVSLQASWVGMDADVVSKGGEVRPDGSLDAHFRLQPTFSSWQDVDYVTLFSSDAAGNASGGQVWTTRAGSNWVLGVLANAMNLNAGYAATLGKFNGTVTLDLYAGDSGWFTQGRTFVIEIGLGTAQPGRQVVTVGAAGTPVTGGGGGAPVTPPAAFAGTITTDRATYAQGEMITVRFSNFPATNDWIALAAAGAPAESYGEWKWTDGSSTSGQPSGAPRRDGTLTFTAPAPGNYEVRAFLNWPGGGTTVRATSAFTVAAAGPTFVSLPADFPATLQWESEGGWTGTWTRRGTSDQFDAAYARSSGERVTTVEEMTGAGNQVRVRRLASSDNILCTLEGTIQTTTRIEGTGACPTTTSGWWWRLTVPAAPAGVETATAGTNAVPVRGQNGRRFRYYCPPNSTGGTVWGTDVYTDDSAICGAAVHAGVIALAAGGTVEIEIRPGLAGYQGSSRNGVTSSNYGAWSGSFVFVGAGGAVLPGGGMPPPGNTCGRRIGTGIIYKWESLGGESGFLGCPTSDEAEATPSPQGTTGRWASFAGATGLIVWHATGQRAGQAYEVHGDISILYYGMGGSASWLGFPVSDEYDAAGGRRSDFEGGYIHWTAATRETKAYPYGQGPAAAFAGMIATDRQSYGAGEAITVTFTNFPGTNDWLTIAPAGAPAEQYGEWQWTNHQPAGTLTFTAPAAGSYEVRAYANWPDAGYTVVAAVPITVGAAGGGGGYPRDLLVSYDAAWIGMDVDGVGSGGSGPPDGAADGHFTLDIDINTPYEVRYIVVYTTDAQGNPAGGQYWHTQNTGNWPLGVYLQGSRLNDGHVASLGTHSGYRRFDLVAANSGYFNAGQHFVVEVDVGLSEPLRRLVVVGGVAAGGGGAPAGGEGAVTVYANQGAPVSTAVLEAGRWYILEASGTISVWDANADKIDAVWCYWVDRCGAAGEHWAQLRVDGMGLSDYSAAAGGPSPLPYDPSHVYRVYVQGQGRALQLVVADAAAGSAGDNGGAFVVRLTPQ